MGYTTFKIQVMIPEVHNQDEKHSFSPKKMKGMLKMSIRPVGRHNDGEEMEKSTCRNNQTVVPGGQ